MTQEQAGIYKLTLIENKGVSINWLSGEVYELTSSGETIEIDNNQEMILNFTPQRSKNNKILVSYSIDCKFYNFDKITKEIVNKLKNSIYGWIAKIEFYNREEKYILSPLKLDNSSINNNLSNHYSVNLVNRVAGVKLVNQSAGIWVLETGIWNSDGVWISSGIWNS